MDYYFDIKLLLSVELSLEALLSEVYSRLHIALVEISNGEIGVSFPQVEKNLGEIIRVHGKKEKLIVLQNSNWYRFLKDYISLTDIIQVPPSTPYRVVKRVQSKSNAERLRRRSIKKGWIAQEDALEKIPDNKEKFLQLPYINIKSFSSGKHFKIFIEHGPIQEFLTPGLYSCYGLSSTTTVPWF